jgi:ABC-type sugar transport system ATPase subunit
MTLAAPLVADRDPRPVALAARGIRKSFGEVEVLHGVDFTLHQGQVHGLVGQNGAGKSTLVKIIDGAYAADAGAIEVNGTRMASRPGGSRKRDIAMVFQEFSLIPQMSVGHNILLTREPRGRLGLIDDREIGRPSQHSPGSAPTLTPTGSWRSCRSAPASSWRSPRPSPGTRAF